MALIKIQTQIEPTTPEDWYAHIYIDIADKKIKIKTDDWVIHVLAQE